jgi:RHS repeat-associated protein
MKRGGVVLAVWGRAFDPENATYDELGRVTSRQIGSSANTQTQAFDNLGRLTTLTNPLGAFVYTYEGVTGRPSSVSYPNGQQTTYAYLDNLGDHRLQEIHNRRPGGATLSKFNYTYDVAGNILTWKQQADSDPAKVYEFGYDQADQLTAAILKSTDPTPQVLKRYHYAYDLAGNRTAEQIDDAVTGASYNNMNQLVSQQAGGALVFKGTVSEPASVTIGGRLAAVTPDNRFEGQAVVPGGTGQVAVTATDPSGNMRTSTYQLSQGATSKAFTYDANGNMTSDGTRTYEWDAANRLTAVKQGATTLASYTYNSTGLRTSRTVDGATTSYVLEEVSVVEERGAGATTKHFQGPSIDTVLATQDGTGVATYLTRDHLSSIREQLSAAGLLTQRRDYDPWGNPAARATVGGWAFTGREWDVDTGLFYYRARYYSAILGRFVSSDPAGLKGGMNRYAYASNGATTRVDPDGLTDLNLFDPAQRVKTPDGPTIQVWMAAALYRAPDAFVVAGHGSGSPIGETILDDSNGVANRTALNAEKLMVLILAHVNWRRGMKVRLLACQAGAPGRLASELATVLQTHVEAPTTDIGWSDQYSTGSQTWVIKNGGKMQTYP